MQGNPAIGILWVGEQIPGAPSEGACSAPISPSPAPPGQPFKRRLGIRMIKGSKLNQESQHKENVHLIKERKVEPGPKAMNAPGGGIVRLDQAAVLEQPGDPPLDGLLNAR